MGGLDVICVPTSEANSAFGGTTRESPEISRSGRIGTWFDSPNGA
ncbi:MAG: hypothetical protein WCI22_15195 [Actinomycetota bacterium]